jgi:hypothetical protein
VTRLCITRRACLYIIAMLRGILRGTGILRGSGILRGDRRRTVHNGGRCRFPPGPWSARAVLVRFLRRFIGLSVRCRFLLRE